MAPTARPRFGTDLSNRSAPIGDADSGAGLKLLLGTDWTSYVSAPLHPSSLQNVRPPADAGSKAFAAAAAAGDADLKMRFEGNLVERAAKVEPGGYRPPRHRLLSDMAPYEVASNIRPALGEGRPGRGGPAAATRSVA